MSPQHRRHRQRVAAGSTCRMIPGDDRRQHQPALLGSRRCCGRSRAKARHRSSGGTRPTAATSHEDPRRWGVIYGHAHRAGMPLVKLCSPGACARTPTAKHYLVTPAEKVDVEVADAPFLAVEMESAGRSGREPEPRVRTKRRRYRHGRPRASAAVRRGAGSRASSLISRARPVGGLSSRARSTTIWFELAVDEGNGLGLWERWDVFRHACGSDPTANKEKKCSKIRHPHHPTRIQAARRASWSAKLAGAQTATSSTRCRARCAGRPLKPVRS